MKTMADKFKFYNISKANDEISRLEALVADRDTALAAAQEKITALESQPKPDATQAENDLKAVKAPLASLGKENTELKAALEAAKTEAQNAKAEAETAKADADKAIAQAKDDAKKQASIQAAAITAGQGQPPIDVKPNEKPAASKPTTELKGGALVLALIEKQISGQK